MAIREILACSVCGEPIRAEPALGDRQGGPVRIQLGATTWELTLCVTCKRPLFDLYAEHVDDVETLGILRGSVALEHLPRDVAPAVIKPPVPTFIP